MKRIFFLASSLVVAVLAALSFPSHFAYALVLLSVFLFSMIFRKVGAVIGLMILFLLIIISFAFVDLMSSTLAAPGFWWKWHWKPPHSWQWRWHEDSSHRPDEFEDYVPVREKMVYTNISELVIEGIDVEVIVDPSITGVILEDNEYAIYKVEGTRLNFANSSDMKAKITVGNLRKLDVQGTAIKIECNGGKIDSMELNGTGISVHGEVETVDTIEVNGMGVKIDLKVHDCRKLEVNGMGTKVQLEYLTSLTDFKYVEVNGMGSDVRIKVPTRADREMIKIEHTGLGINVEVNWWD